MTHDLSELDLRKYKTNPQSACMYLVASDLVAVPMTFGYREYPIFIRHYRKFRYIDDRFKNKDEAVSYIVDNIHDPNSNIVLLGFHEKDLDFFTDRYFTELI